MKEPYQDKYIFFIDGKEFVTEHSSLTGKEIKAMASIPGEYQLFLGKKGDEPNQAISDGDNISLSKPDKHFYIEPYQDKYIFFIDGKEFVTEHPSLTGQEIKAMASIPGEYQLFLEKKGDEPDQAISDGLTVSLSKPDKHFYAVPPATFG